jgi:hypothetical protein
MVIRSEVTKQVSLSNMIELFSKIVSLVLFAVTVTIVGCNQTTEDNNAKEPIYVKPSVDKNGKYRKGHVRMPVSTKKDAIKSRARSKYYYHTRGKYRKK